MLICKLFILAAAINTFTFRFYYCLSVSHDRSDANARHSGGRPGRRVAAAC